MSTLEIANRLYELCKQGQFETVHNELFGNDVTSTEKNMQGQIETKTGIEAIKEKGKNFQNMLEEMHSSYTNPPVVYGNYIFMEMGLDATMKGMGRMNMKEMCCYEVKNEKIISEQFYY